MLSRLRKRGDGFRFFSSFSFGFFSRVFGSGYGVDCHFSLVVSFSYVSFLTGF